VEALRAYGDGIELKRGEARRPLDDYMIDDLVLVDRAIVALKLYYKGKHAGTSSVEIDRLKAIADFLCLAIADTDLLAKRRILFTFH